MWGESSDGSLKQDCIAVYVLIPDLWGESSDFNYGVRMIIYNVLIPDLWGESSDRMDFISVC